MPLSQNSSATDFEEASVRWFAALSISALTARAESAFQPSALLISKMRCAW